MRTTATSILVLFLALWEAYAMQVDIYAHKDKFGQSLNMDISERECTNVPNPWRNVTMSVDTHGSCMQFYDGKSCTGRIAVIQPFHTVHQMDLSLINFHNVIQSVSPCGAKVPAKGMYVIQSAVDSSILTVSKYENQFATVHTLPPRAFIPKAQQWEIIEKVPTEYDIEPRIHQTNVPVTYDAEAMKRGSFIRKKWKIESVGRGRYVFKSEWSGKCLYKTRFRTIEEHDCRAWSPNQEWVLRPLLTAKPNPPIPPALNEEAKYNVPSKIVEEYLEQQKFVREQQDINGDFKGNTYKITNKRKKPSKIEDDSFRSRKQDLNEPPQPKVFYSRNQPNFLRSQYSSYSLPSREVMYMEGSYPVFQKVEVQDPVFPDFLLHAVQRNEPPPEPEKYKPASYLVTRRPSGPLPTGHPNFVPRRRKYDGRIKIPITNKPAVVKPVESEEDEEDEEDDKKDALPDTTEDNAYEALLRDKEEREQNGNESAESEEEDEDEEEEEDTAQDEKRKKEEKEIEQDSEEDPAKSVAGFMKLLFKGISNKMQDEDRAQEEMINTFER